jgi:hypothetical protein
MDFREYTVTRDGPELFILGTILPVHWDFSIRLCEDDLPGIARVLLQRMLGWLLRAAFRAAGMRTGARTARRTWPRGPAAWRDAKFSTAQPRPRACATKERG